MNNIWLTSDLHFNHDRSFLYEPRGFNSITEMNKKVIENFNSVVAPDDYIYILGDLCLGGSSNEIMLENKKLIESLNGSLHIIRGNHDTDRRMEMYKECKNVVSATGEWARMIIYKKLHLYLSHFPTITSNIDKESIYLVTLNLYGHTHQKEEFYTNSSVMYHVGLDSNNCYPVLLDNIIEKMKNEYLKEK